MPGDSYSPYPAAMKPDYPTAVTPAATLPPAVLLFLRLCLAAGLFNNVLLFGVVMLNPHQSHAEFTALQQHPDTNIFALRLCAGFILCAVMAPIVLLPYWLGLAVVYARNVWAQGLLYFGACMYLLMTMGIGIRHGLFSPALSGLLVETALGVAALICLGRTDMREWLSATIPAFAPRTYRY
jgi:hypothetical protein